MDSVSFRSPSAEPHIEVKVRNEVTFATPSTDEDEEREEEEDVEEDEEEEEEDVEEDEEEDQEVDADDEVKQKFFLEVKNA